MRFGFRHALSAFAIALVLVLILDAWVPLSWILLLFILVVVTIALSRVAFWLDALVTAIRLSKQNRDTLPLVNNIRPSEITTFWVERLNEFMDAAKFRGQAALHQPVERLKEEVDMARMLQETLYVTRDQLSESQRRMLTHIQDAERNLLLPRLYGTRRCTHPDPVHISESIQGSTAFHTYWCPVCLSTTTSSWPIYAIPAR